ncbi:MAG: D-glycero-beta-D-manno-heptose 1-phosphate adenylyltransferase [Phycisphaerales bacterium]|nr:D-glycero-beta-D-manno-heptose 1-phosphate adenylyltransferase [Phycisphaerales bacterium]
MSTRLIQLVERLAQARIVLVGDLMIDRYLYGNAERLSPDAPVPVLNYRHEDSRLGGAGRVAADLAMLGVKVSVVSIVGDDQTGRQLRAMLQEIGCDTTGMVETPGRLSTSKVRLVGLAQHRHAQQLIRLDYEDSSPIDPSIAQRVLQVFEQQLSQCDAVCLEDYNKGLLTESLCQQLIDLARQAGKPVFVDPAALDDYRKYTGASAITPNRVEAARAAELPCDSEADYRSVAERLLTDLQLDCAVLTLDKNGAYFAASSGERRWLKTRPRKVYDVAGAGDMVLAVLAASRSVGASWEEAVVLGNIAGGLEVEKFGSVPLTRDEIIAEILIDDRRTMGKQRTLEALLPELARHRAAGRRIVFTNGCFDLIHLGHVSYFRFARSQGEVLVVAVNTDHSIRRLKGKKRPIINEHDRMSVLEELESIDYVITFDDDTPLKLIEAIRPDVLVKGADYTRENVVGADFVEQHGGQIALAPLVDGRSTSAVIQRILEAYK